MITGGPVSVELLNSFIDQLVIKFDDWEVIGFNNGFSGLLQDRLVNLSSILEDEHCENGDLSYLVTERKLPKRNADFYQQVVTKLRQHELQGLVVVGGNGTACALGDLNSYLIENPVRIWQIPKTMDGDYIDSFCNIGFPSALFHSIRELSAYRKEASLLGAPCVVKMLGREVGQLAFRAGMKSKASLVLIAEELRKLKRSVKIDEVLELITAAELKSLAWFDHFGVVGLAEGVIDCLDRVSQEAVGVRYIKHGKNQELVDFANSDLEVYLRDRLKELLREIGFDKDCQVAARRIGYLARASEPSEEDIQLAMAYANRLRQEFDKEPCNEVMILMPPGQRCIPLERMIRKDGEAYQLEVDISSEEFRESVNLQLRVERQEVDELCDLLAKKFEGLDIERIRSIFNASADIFSQLKVN